MASATLVQIATSPNFTEGTILVDKSMEWTSGMVNEIDINSLGEDAITPETRVHARAQIRHHTTGGSGWGPSVSFGLASHKTLTTGMCLISSGPGITKPIWKRIDLQGKFDNDTFNYRKHHLYTKKIFQTSSEGNEFIVFKTIYVKCSPNGIFNTDCAGKPSWWLSTHKWDETWKPCSTFVRNNVVNQQILIAKNLGSVVGNKLASLSSAPITTDRNKDEFMTFIGANNVDGVSGYRMFDYHDYSLLKLLFLIFNSGFGIDASTSWQATSGEPVNTFLGIKNFWSNHYWTVVDKVSIGTPSANKLNVLNTDTNSIAFVSDHGLQEGYFDRSFASVPTQLNNVERNTLEFVIPIDQLSSITNVTEATVGGFLEGTDGSELLMGKNITYSYQEDSVPKEKNIPAHILNIHRGYQDVKSQIACRMCKS